MATIEEDLLTSLLKAGCITDDVFVSPQTGQFQRAARTDKGVSAARQVVSIKMGLLPVFLWEHLLVVVSFLGLIL